MLETQEAILGELRSILQKLQGLQREVFAWQASPTVALQ